MNYKSTAHLLHLIVTVIFPFWAIVWIWRTLSNSQHNRKVELKLRKESLEEMKRNNWRN